MPRGDQTGPRGMGPRSGRAAGYCVGYNSPGFMNPRPRGGMGMGYARGCGFRGGQFWNAPAPAWARTGAYPEDYGYPRPEDEREMLRQQTQLLERELQMMQERLKELDRDN